MLYKPDFEEIVPRMEACWRRELLDRACISIHAPNGKKRREIPEPPTLYEKWTNHEYVLDRAEADMEATYYAGDAIPVLRPNLGPDLFSALMGGTIEYREDTSWVAPCIADWNEAPSFEIDKDSFEWKWHLEIYDKAKERSKGRYFVAAPDCHSGGDALLAMRGGTNLCMDIYDHPDALRAAMDKLEKAVIDFHEGFWEPIEANCQKGHATSWMRMWSPGRSNVIQLDLLALISPEQFREFFYHELEVQCGALENTLFHLDGPDAVKHLPVLYELPGNSAAIQWVHGAGKGPMTKWLALLKEMQSHGMGLHLSCEAAEVETLMRELSSKGLYLSTWAKNVEEADELVRLAAALTHE